VGLGDPERPAGSGGRPHTNQRMEIQAVLEAGRALDGQLLVVSDPLTSSTASATGGGGAGWPAAADQRQEASGQPGPPQAT
jgi:hypothetical protein